jgi:hypothetical protein
MERTYHIADEPEPGRYAKYAVSSHWPFLATILGGSWIGLPWFLFNGHAVGSATRKQELRAVLFANAFALVFAFVAFGLIDSLGIPPSDHAGHVAGALGLPDRAYSYAWVGVIALKLWFVYRIQWLQEKSTSIHESYGGKLMNGAIVVAAAYFARSFVFAAAGKISVYLLVVVL